MCVCSSVGIKVILQNIIIKKDTFHVANLPFWRGKKKVNISLPNKEKPWNAIKWNTIKDKEME